MKNKFEFEKFYTHGEWEHEPDEPEEWVHAELRCYISRFRGHLNGYVGIPEGHPLYGKDYDYDAFCELEVHGGVTHSSLGDGKWRPEGSWWIGFDTCHAWDYQPPVEESVYQVHMDVTGKAGPSEHETYRNWAYVKEQTESLAEQLAAMWQPPSYEEWRERVNKA